MTRAAQTSRVGSRPGVLASHWPEYAIEAALLGLFMLSACLVTAAVEHPGSPLRQALSSELLRRVAIGVSMGATAIALIYSPWGARSGAHFNPAVTFAFWRLGRVERTDALAYVVAQCAGGIAGVLLARAILGTRLAHPAVAFVATVPSAGGPAIAFAAELAISFLTMTVVLGTSSRPGLAPYTGICCGALVATYISLEAPLSGMSMNPARSLASAVVGGTWTGFWIYCTAPVLGMLAAAELNLRGPHVHRALCAKLQHENTSVRCIFRCARGMTMPILLAWALAVAPAPWATPDSWAGSIAAPAQIDAGAAPSLPEVPVAPRVESVDAIGFTVADLDRSLAFYTDVLTFEKESESELVGDEVDARTGLFGVRARSARLRLGDERVELTEYLVPRGRPYPADSRSNDGWFQHVALIVRDMDQAYERLRQHRVEHASTGPQTLPEWNPHAAGIRAFYFRDPDGHPLEILQFPPDKGDPRWHRSGERLFLGIDHTAVVVGDTDASLRLYRDVLGLRVAGESENWGPEQEHLNHVFGAHLRITTLRAPRGPGIEFLEYLTPRDGRPAPSDLRANDIAHEQTRLTTRGVDGLARELRATGAALVSAPPVPPRGDATSPEPAELLVRDRDGHGLEFVAPSAGGATSRAPAPALQKEASR